MVLNHQHWGWSRRFKGLWQGSPSWQGSQCRRLTRNNDMWLNCGLAVAIGIVMSFGEIATVRAGESRTNVIVSGRASQDAASGYQRKRPLTVTIYRKRRGGY